MDDEKFLKCIVDNNRRQILKCLGSSELCVNDIIKTTHLEQTLVSFHLKALKNCGLVRSRRDGKNIMYSVTDLEILNVLNLVKDLASKIKIECESNECNQN